MNDFKISDDDFSMMARRVIEKMALNVLHGITYGVSWLLDENEFQITVNYYYRDSDKVVYKDKLPNYLRNMTPKYAEDNIYIAYRHLITRSFSTEINRIFGGDFNPL